MILIKTTAHTCSFFIRILDLRFVQMALKFLPWHVIVIFSIFMLLAIFLIFSLLEVFPILSILLTLAYDTSNNSFLANYISDTSRKAFLTCDDTSSISNTSYLDMWYFQCSGLEHSLSHPGHLNANNWISSKNLKLYPFKKVLRSRKIKYF